MASDGDVNAGTMPPPRLLLTPSPQCSICLDALDADDAPTHVLPCGCVLHRACVRSYVSSALGDRDAVLQCGGIPCPLHFAGSCRRSGKEEMRFITPKDVEALGGMDDETFKLARWLREAGRRRGSTKQPTTATARKVTARVVDVDVDDEQTLAFIAATTKRCPNPTCCNRESHFHGHQCHHVHGGCGACRTEYCYRCLGTAEENVRLRGDKKHCVCGFWSNFCKPLQGAAEIEEHLALTPYPHDRRCGCAVCPECREGKPCGTCPGDCAVCAGWLQPGPTDLRAAATWAPQTDAQRRKSLAHGRVVLRWLQSCRRATLDAPHLAFFEACRAGRVGDVARALAVPGVVDVDATDAADGGRTALMVAAEAGHVEVGCSALPAYPPAKALDTAPCLFLPFSCCLQVCRALLAHGASPNRQEHVGGHTAVHLVTRHGHIEETHVDVVRVLCEHGADPNLPGRFDVTPLHRVRPCLPSAPAWHHPPTTS